MNLEKSPELHSSETVKPQEEIPSRFPVVEDTEFRYYDEEPEPQEGVIVHFVKKFPPNEKKNCYILLKHIADLNYIFYLYESFGIHKISFKTKEYEYAVADLEKSGREDLFAAIAAFVASIQEYTKDGIDTIEISPANQAYTIEEIEECMQQILTLPNTQHTREELLSKYKGFRVFDLYEKLFGKNFHKVHYNHVNRAHSRSRLFRAAVAKHLPPGWEVQEDPFWKGADFYVRRKKESAV